MEKITAVVSNETGDSDNAPDRVPIKSLPVKAAEREDSIIKTTNVAIDQVKFTASESSNSDKNVVNDDSKNKTIVTGMESKLDTSTIHDKSNSRSDIESDRNLQDDEHKKESVKANKVDVPDGNEKISTDLDTVPELNTLQEELPLPVNNDSESSRDETSKGSCSEKGDKNLEVRETPSAVDSVPAEAAEVESIDGDIEENAHSVAVSPPNKGISQSRTEQSKDAEASSVLLINETAEKSQSGSLDANKAIDNEIGGSSTTISEPNESKKDNSKNIEESADVNTTNKQPEHPSGEKSDEPLQSDAGKSSAPTGTKTPTTTASGSSDNPSDEDATLVSETGDDDQVMQEFLHVSAKEKDIDDPMSLEESMEVSGQSEEDPFGLPDLDAKIPDEPMDVDETADKEKSGETTDTGEKDGDEGVSITDKESDAESAEPVVEATEPSDESPTEPTKSPAEDSSPTTASTAVASTAVDDETEADEEICIIPDTIRVPPPGTPTHIPAETTKETAPTIAKPAEKANTDSVFDSLKGSDVTETASDNVIKEKEPTVDVAVEEKGADAAVDVVEKPAVVVNRDKVTVRLMEKEPTNSIECTSDDILDVVPSMQTCFQCKKEVMCKFQVLISGITKYVCDGPCSTLFRNERNSVISAKSVGAARSSGDFTRKCAHCTATILLDERNLSWETMDFCNEDCLGKYQTQLGSFCANCKGSVAGPSLGKYCVRFGYDIKQFCCSLCLEEYKKGLKVCSYCQKDISNDTNGFLAPVGDKGQFKRLEKQFHAPSKAIREVLDFCTQKCMEKYDYMSNNQPPPTEMHKCDVCTNEKIVRVEVIIGLKLHKLCSDPCFAVFKFVNKVVADQCEMCKKYFDKVKTDMFSVYYNESAHDFCSKTCMNVYILANRKIVPCNWCKVKKYNFDMIKRISGGHAIMMCSLNCLMLFKVSVNAVSSKKIKCDYCLKLSQAQYHLTMSDATIRNFCQYDCVMAFQGQYAGTPPLQMTGGLPVDKQVIPTGQPKRNVPRRSVPQNENNSVPQVNSMPVISSVKSLAPNGQQVSQSTNARSAAQKTVLLSSQVNNAVVPPPKPQVVIKQQVVITPAPPQVVRNKGTSCKPMMTNKGVSCRPTQATKECQTDDSIGRPIFIPVPVPIFVPAPMAMYSLPFPMPVPFPVPVPVPMFIPTTRSSAKGILKDIKRIREKMPTDPFEAELLMMAEMVAGEKKPANSDSDSDDGDNGAGDINEVAEASSVVEEGFSPEAVDTSNFGEDMLQMALKMASELDEPAVDLEESLTPSTITAQPNAVMEHNDVSEADVDDGDQPMAAIERTPRGRKRQQPASSRRGSMATPSKRGRRISSSGGDVPLLLPPPDSIPVPRVEVEKPDAHMCLKFTFGVNAWRQWVNVKNAELEKGGSNARKAKLFKPEILQLTSDELNYSLCLFVKEVRKPNNTEYAPDTIYYLVLGIQQYLFENGRIDNIFTDSYYEKFTECLDEVAKKFSLLFNDQQYIVTRVEEEHLWESKQLGAHSPHVLLSTLMFFNTKHFNLTTVEEHMQLSFSHIMKHWKRNPNQPGATKTPGSRNVLLRFYPPQAALEANSRKKKVYEQQENEENPLRCPVKLYEFYLSKCPESVKTRNDVFYLLPERSCVPDSPVWYSTMALSKEPLMKMLHRVKMVKEINMALLTS